MKRSNLIRFILPGKLCLELKNYLQVNEPNFSYRIEYFYYIIHVLTMMEIRNKNYEYHALNLQYLINVTASNIDRYIKVLRNGEFIETDNNYEPGKKKLWYRIAPKYQEGTFTFDLPSDSRMFRNLIQLEHNKRAHDNRLPQHLKEMKTFFLNIGFNHEAAYHWIIDNANANNKYKYFAAVNSFQDKRFLYFKRNRTNNRLDTNLTNLKSELRQFIIGDFVSIDLKNSQPFFLNLLINLILNINDKDCPLCCHFESINPSEVFGVRAIQKIINAHRNLKSSDLVSFKQFEAATINGNFYEIFGAKYDGNLQRDDIKDILFKVMFSQNLYHKNYKPIIPYKKEKEIFQSVFPFVYDVIHVLKEKKHNLLAVTLQKMESQLFIDDIARELVYSGIIPLTIHDSIIVEEQAQESAVEVINNIFYNQCGVTPTFHINNLKNK